MSAFDAALWAFALFCGTGALINFVAFVIYVRRRP